MKLYEFIKKRLAERGMKCKDLNDGGISNPTLQRIRVGNTSGLREGTFQKLALILKCSIGDLKACCTEENTVTPNGHDLDLMVRELMGTGKVTEKKTESVNQTNNEPDEPDAYVINVPADQKDSVDDVPDSVHEEDGTDGEARYRQQLKEMCLRIFATGVPGVHSMKDIYADIGYALFRNLVEK